MPTVEVLRCPSCNRVRDHSPEHTHRIVSGRGPLTECPDCRHPAPKLSSDERRKLEAWWVDRLGLEECREIATGLFA